jgi:transcriptional regulator GlxA family with amidase domain
MKVSNILSEHGLEIDDVRWYLAHQLAVRLLEYRAREQDLTRLIWSGRLEAELYNAEERYLEELQRKVEAGLADEHSLREIAQEIAMQKRKRQA